MNKKQVQEIVSLASFIFTEAEYKQFMRLINGNYLNMARLFLDDFIIALEAKRDLDPDDEVLLLQYTQCDKLQDLVLGLIIDNVDERKQEQTGFAATK